MVKDRCWEEKGNIFERFVDLLYKSDSHRKSYIHGYLGSIAGLDELRRERHRETERERDKEYN